jgi:hypothetical protein
VAGLQDAATSSSQVVSKRNRFDYGKRQSVKAGERFQILVSLEGEASEKTKRLRVGAAIRL